MPVSDPFQARKKIAEDIAATEERIQVFLKEHSGSRATQTEIADWCKAIGFGSQSTISRTLQTVREIREGTLPKDDPPKDDPKKSSKIPKGETLENLLEALSKVEKALKDYRGNLANRTAFAKYLKQEKSKPHRYGLILAILISFALFYVTINYNWYDKSLTGESPGLTLDVSLLVATEDDYNNTPFYKEVDSLFFKESGVRINFLRKADTLKSIDELIWLFNHPNIYDIVIGGPPEILGYFKNSKSANITKLVPINTDGLDLPFWGHEKLWVPCYYGLMGIAYNADLELPNNQLISNWATIPQLLEGKRYSCPNLKSSGAYSLQFSFGFDSQGLNFSPELGMKRYENLFLGRTNYPAQRDNFAPLLGLASNHVEYHIGYLHDWIWKSRNHYTPAYLENIRWILPRGAVEVVCISILQKQHDNDTDEYLKAAQKFVRFYLRKDIQELQYRRLSRIPVITSVRDTILKHDQTNYGKEVRSFFMTNNFPITSIEWFRQKPNEFEWFSYCEQVYESFDDIKDTVNQSNISGNKRATYGFRFGE